MIYYKFTLAGRLKLTYIVPADSVSIVRVPGSTVDKPCVCVTGLSHPYPREYGSVSELSVINEADLAADIADMMLSTTQVANG
jgi:hypothetical protein